MALLPATLFAILGIVFQRYHHSIKQQGNVYILKNEKLELELALVKSQLNPHFLFNTLNNIEYLIKKAPDKASESVIQLSSLLRYQVYEMPERKVKVEKDINMIENYLALELARLNNPELVMFKKTVTNTDVLIAPALLFPFIENAFKHCNLNELDAYIEINLKGSDTIIDFTIKNSKYESRSIENPAHNGVGLSLVHKRLNLSYPNLYKINVEDLKNSFSVSLQISLT
nr:histidine kinase [uncultured Allomuricauda sp.]